MKAKTIKAILAKKHNEFVASISDEAIRKLVEKNSIITGGAIVSLLLGEKVNDFDYYFTNEETCQAVAEYFVSKYKERNTDCGNIFVKNDDARIKIYVKSAGVAVDESMADNEAVDAELADHDIADAEIDQQSADEGKYIPLFLSSNAITLSNKIQLICRFYGKPEEIHSNYDFVHATCYWQSETGELVLPAKALEAILTRELIYVGSKYPLCSIIRTRKFVKRGWNINAGQFLKMALQLNELNLKDISVLEDQLTGIDSAYFMMAIDAIKRRKEQDQTFEIDNQYLFTIINKIF